MESILYLVLTYDPQTAPESLDAQYRELQPRWKALEQMLRRGVRELGFEGVGKFDYATYVEAHRSGRPHMNVVIVSRELADYLRENPPSDSDLDASASHGGKRAPKWFRELAHRANFGPLASLRHAESRQAVASYVTKFDKGAVADPTLAGEVTKLSQLPVLAPPRFRRTRSSRGFLPPLETNPELTGELLFARVDAPEPARPSLAEQRGIQRAQLEALTAGIPERPAPAPSPPALNVGLLLALRQTLGVRSVERVEQRPPPLGALPAGDLAALVSALKRSNAPPGWPGAQPRAQSERDGISGGTPAGSTASAGIAQGQYANAGSSP